jgi:hypothetical protein
LHYYSICRIKSQLKIGPPEVILEKLLRKALSPKTSSLELLEKVSSLKISEKVLSLE